MTSGRFQVLEGGASQHALPNEELLIVSAQQGNTAAFKELYEHYRQKVYNLVYYSLDDVDQTEDVLQTVFIKVFQAMPYFRLESGFLTWIYRVALNECKNRKRRRKLFIPISHINDGIDERDPAPTPEAIHVAEQTGRLVRKAVRALKPKYRSVVVLKYLEEMSYEEIAATLGCSSGTVASRLYRALEILQKQLGTLRGEDMRS